MLKHALIAVCCVTWLGCRQAREQAVSAPVYAHDIEELLQARCSRCHGQSDAGAGVAMGVPATNDCR